MDKKNFFTSDKNITESDFIEYLNELGIPEKDRHSNGGRIPDSAEFGTWLYYNDQIAFNCAYQDYTR